MTDKPILTTKECAEYGHIFSRFAAYEISRNAVPFRREQKICPTCNKPVFVVQVEYPRESL